MHFFLQILNIVIIDLVLSGDNAVVIGMAAHRLAPAQRKKAIMLGGGAAIVLRIALTAIAAFLLGQKGLQLGGGLLLLWIGFKLLKQEEENHEGVKAAGSMKEAVITILIADVVMSLDNVIAVAGVSHKSAELLIFGLVLSMGILMLLGNLVANLITKLWWLAYVGSGVIAWTGGLMIFEDKFVSDRWEWTHRIVETQSATASTSAVAPSVYAYVCIAAITVLTLGFAHWFHRVRKS